MTAANALPNALVLVYSAPTGQQALFISAERIQGEWFYSQPLEVGPDELATTLKELQRKWHYRRMHPVRTRTLQEGAKVKRPDVLYQGKIVSADEALEGAKTFREGFLKQMEPDVAQEEPMSDEDWDRLEWLEAFLAINPDHPGCKMVKPFGLDFQKYLDISNKGGPRWLKDCTKSQQTTMNT